MAPAPAYPGYDPEVAAAMEASASCQMRIMASFIGFLGFCWILLGAFFLYCFFKPLNEAETDSGVELRTLSRDNKKPWWAEDYGVA
ncbi:hypothetical protein AAE478_007311 [Parahypoxylon ruwenzoriense]